HTRDFRCLRARRGSSAPAPKEVTMRSLRFSALAVGLFAVGSGAARPAGDGFYDRMDAAMERMHAGMHVAPSGDVDRDFAAMMIPHHQGAIDMALLELRFGHDKRLRRLAQSIIVEQGQEIQLMHSILGDK